MDLNFRSTTGMNRDFLRDPKPSPFSSFLIMVQLYGLNCVGPFRYEQKTKHSPLVRLCCTPRIEDNGDSGKGFS